MSGLFTKTAISRLHELVAYLLVIQIAGSKRSIHVPRVQPALFNQSFQTDKHMITGMCRQALVGRAMEMCWSQGQHLPDCLATRLQKIYKAIGLGTQVTIGPTPRQ